jgi:hypothetical protein
MIIIRDSTAPDRSRSSSAEKNKIKGTANSVPMPLPLSICMQLEAAGIGWPACTCRHRWFPFCCHGTGNASHHRLAAVRLAGG